MIIRQTEIIWENDLFALSIPALLLLFLWILKRRYPQKIKQKVSEIPTKYFTYAGLILFIGFFIHFTLRWALARFPLLDPQTVVFTLSMPLEGVDSETFASVVKQIVLPAIFFVAISIFLIFLIKKNLHQHLRLPFKAKKIPLVISYTVLFLAVSSIFITLPVDGYMYVIDQRKAKPEHSAFYEKYYVNPEEVNITFPYKKKNLVLIIMESMENTFSDKQSGGGLFEKDGIPELTRLAKNNINFSHNNLVGGGKDLFGTHWTIAGIIAKTCGIPFNMPIDGNANFSVDFLPGAKGLTDVLSDNGYKQRFLFGSKKTFASRGKFFETHGNVEVLDLLHYKEIGKVPEDYYVFWGIEDAKLFALAKEELEDISAQDKPFMLGMLTVDTHFPHGYICDLCDKETVDDTDSSKLQTVFRCASKQVNDFISWIQSQSWSRDTVIVVVGDHLFMDKETFPKEIKESRGWLNVFINSSINPKAEKNRNFSSFDMFPSILESMGVKVEGHALGLGRSLFSNRPTILEELKDVEYINNELMMRNIQYDNFIYNVKYNAKN